MMQESIAQLAPRFSMHRAVIEYAERYYLPAHKLVALALDGQPFCDRLGKPVELVVPELGVGRDEDDFPDYPLGSSGSQVRPVRRSGDGFDAAGRGRGVETCATEVRHQCVAIRGQDREDPVRRVDRLVARPHLRRQCGCDSLACTGTGLEPSDVEPAQPPSEQREQRGGRATADLPVSSGPGKPFTEPVTKASRSRPVAAKVRAKSA